MMTITQFDMFQGDSQRAISKKPGILQHGGQCVLKNGRKPFLMKGNKEKRLSDPKLHKNWTVNR